MFIWEIENYLTSKVRVKLWPKHNYIHLKKGVWYDEEGGHYPLEPYEVEGDDWEEYIEEPEKPKLVTTQFFELIRTDGDTIKVIDHCASYEECLAEIHSCPEGRYEIRKVYLRQ